QAKQQQPTSAEIDAAVNRVLKDAEQRSRIFSGDSFVGGWNADKQQFFLGSRDGSFYLHPGIVLQFRNSTSFRQDGKKSGENDLQNGFEVRRAKFGFDGNIFGPDLTYKFQWQSSTNGGNPTVEYAWVQYLLAHKIAGGPNDFAIRAGQFKDVVYKEEFTGDPVQLMTERSLANALIGGVALGPLVQGVDFMLVGKDAPVHAEL